jgi:hypothetical protein
MVIRWLFRFVALFLGRKAWEAFRRRRTTTRGAASSYSGTSGTSGTVGGPSGDRRSGRSRVV